MSKASFSLSFGWIGMCQYPLAKSRVEKNFAFANLSKRVSILGKGSASVLIIVLNFQKSIQNRVFFPLSLLSTKVTDAEYGEQLF